MTKTVKFALKCCCLLLLPSAALAEAPFTVSGTIQNGSAVNNISASFSDVKQAINYFDSSSLQSQSASYNDNSGVAANITYLGAAVRLSFAQNSTALTFIVPGAGINQTFTGATRNESVSQLVTFLTGKGGSELNVLEKYLAASSPVSPLAGNPNSLQSSVAASSFSESGFNTGSNASANSGTGSRFGISVSAGQFNSGGFSGTSYTMPISYAYVFTKSGWELLVNVPLTYEKIGNGASYSVQGGIGLQIPVKPGTDWYITPIISAGAAASVNFGAAGATYSYAIGSRYTYHATPGLDITLGDMVGQVSSLGVKVAGYDINPKISDTVLKNGVLVEYKTPFSVHSFPLSIRGGYAYTNYFGTKLYMNGYSEMFADFGVLTTQPTKHFYQRLRVGLIGTFGRNYSAISGGLGYSF